MTVSDGGTVVAALGAVVVGIGTGGFFIVNGETFPIAGGIEAAIQESACVSNVAKRCGEEVVFKALEAGDVAEEEKGQEDRQKTLTTSTTSISTTSISTLSSTTSTPTPSSTMATTYLVYPISSASQGELSAFTNTLQQQLGQDNVQIITDRNGLVLLWITILTPSQLKIVSGSQIVSC